MPEHYHEMYGTAMPHTLDRSIPDSIWKVGTAMPEHYHEMYGTAMPHTLDRSNYCALGMPFW